MRVPLGFHSPFGFLSLYPTRAPQPFWVSFPFPPLGLHRPCGFLSRSGSPALVGFLSLSPHSGFTALVGLCPFPPRAPQPLWISFVLGLPSPCRFHSGFAAIVGFFLFTPLGLHRLFGFLSFFSQSGFTTLVGFFPARVPQPLRFFIFPHSGSTAHVGFFPFALLGFHSPCGFLCLFLHSGPTALVGFFPSWAPQPMRVSLSPTRAPQPLWVSLFFSRSGSTALVGFFPFLLIGLHNSCGLLSLSPTRAPKPFLGFFSFFLQSGSTAFVGFFRARAPQPVRVHSGSTTLVGFFLFAPLGLQSPCAFFPVSPTRAPQPLWVSFLLGLPSPCGFFLFPHSGCTAYVGFFAFAPLGFHSPFWFLTLFLHSGSTAIVGFFPTRVPGLCGSPFSPLELRSPSGFLSFKQAHSGSDRTAAPSVPLL